MSDLLIPSYEERREFGGLTEPFDAPAHRERLRQIREAGEQAQHDRHPWVRYERARAHRDAARVAFLQRGNAADCLRLQWADADCAKAERQIKEALDVAA